jgi:hypothetical protein
MTETSTLIQDTFYQEFCAPLYRKYENDENFIVELKDGTKCWNIQYAFLKEPKTFTPLTNEEGLVYGFYVEGFPQYLFADSQYTEESAWNTLFYSMKHFNETGKKVQIISYHGFSDAYQLSKVVDFQ